MRRTSSIGSRHVSGFSLLELLVALVLLALLFRITAPRLDGVLERQRLGASARDIVSTLRLARTRALTTQQAAAVHFDLARHAYQLEGRPERYPLPPGATVTMTTARSEADGDEGAFRFYPDGSTTGGRLSMQAAGLTMAINLHWLTGHIAVTTQ